MSERWKPKHGEAYYFFNSAFNVDRDPYKESYGWDNERIAVGNCFETREEAQAAAEKVKELLLSLHEPTTDGSQLVTDCNQLPDWCKVGKWVYHDSDGYYYTVKSIDIENDNIQITDEESKYTYTANELKTLFSPARLRPYNAKEMKALVGKVITHSPTWDVSFVTGFCNGTEKIYSGTNCFNAETLLKDFTINNAPCGVLEHLENGEWVE